MYVDLQWSFGVTSNDDGVPLQNTRNVTASWLCVSWTYARARGNELVNQLRGDVRMYVYIIMYVGEVVNITVRACVLFQGTTTIRRQNLEQCIRGSV